MTDTRQPALLAAAAALVGLLVLSGWAPFDRATWWLEVFPVLVALPLLWITHGRYPLTTLVYTLIFAHCCVLMLGGAYTYARVPLGARMQEWWALDRNPYDKIGHFFQGFAPVMIAREVFLRGAYIRGRRMLAFVCGCVVLAISAVYELIEWAAAEAFGQGAEEFLGTQGYAWDTQSDMLFALIGAVTGLVLLARLHDRQLRALRVLPES